MYGHFLLDSGFWILTTEPLRIIHMDVLEEKYRRLKEALRVYGSLLVAYSGGIDSALLLKVAHDELGDQALGVIGDSPSLARSELRHAHRFAQEIGARMKVVGSRELDDPGYAKNPSDRCYYCKAELYHQLQAVAREEKLAVIANGANVDDLEDYRPGHQAADEYRVVSPLKEAGFTKQDIRLLAQRLGLAIWDKPASPCLASRIPYGEAISTEKLKQVELAEECLRALGIRELRVRHFGKQAMIEVHSEDFPILERNREAIEYRFRELGFLEVEKRPFRSGILNDSLKTGPDP